MTILDLFAELPALFVGVVFVFALLVGSFLNVVIYRLPIMMQREWAAECAELAGEKPAAQAPFNLVVPRSACPSCGHAIGALENIPVLSYLVLRGRCAGCKTRISARYPAVELATAVLAAIVAWRFGPGLEAIAGVALTFALVALSGIDIDHQLLPDSIVLPMLWLGLLMSLAHPVADAKVLFLAPADAILGASVGYLALYSVATLFRWITGKDGMGNGDFKLLALFGAWLGLAKLPVIILLSAGVGSVIGIAMIAIAGRDRQLPIPFGPYLAAAGWLAMVYGDALMAWYLRFFGLNQGALG